MDQGDRGGGCAGDFRYAAAFKLGEMDSENLRNRSPDLRGANADHRLHHDPLEVAKILEHIGEQTSRAPPLMPTDPVLPFCDFSDMNFQYPKAPWYPDPPTPDF